MKSVLAAAALILASFAASAQHGGGHHQHAAPASPYAAMTGRAIKALSPEQIADLESGAGMSLALAAELNGYPGPRHVLEHAEALRLTADQRSRVQHLAHKMQAEAVALGRRVIEAETALDKAFASGAIDAPRLDTLTADIGRLMGALRVAHLRTHLETKAALTPAQISEYGRLRGYAPR